MGDFVLYTTPYGRPAAMLLRERISAAKAGDPLRPVTVVVPTNSVGVSVRRLLASGRLGPVTAGNGVAGLTLLTVYRLAELLGAPGLAADGRRPVSTPVIAAAVRRVLAREPGLFAAVREHPSTEEELVRAHRELSEVGAASLDRLAQRSPRAGDVVRISRAVRSLLEGDWYEESDLMAAATAAVAAGSSMLDDVGTLVVHLPQDLSPPAAALLRAVGRRRPVEVLAGRTGAPQADADVDRCLRRLGVDPSAGSVGGSSAGSAGGPPAGSTGGPSAGSVADPPAGATVGPPVATEIISVSDPEEEMRSAVATVLEAARDGVPLERMAVLYPATEPYARIAHDQLAAAAIPYNGRAVRPLADRVLGRWLLDLLALRDEGFSRPAVMNLLSAAPLLGPEGRRVKPGAWERASREAGVVRGRDEWAPKLARFADDLRRRVELERDEDEPREWRIDQLRRAAGSADELRAFVGDLFAQLDAARAMASWSDLARWCVGVAARYLGDERSRQRWPEVERAAADRVGEALDRLAGLDAVAGAATMEVFGRTLQLELDSDLGRVGQLGRGVLVGTVSAALGVDLDLVVVLGLAEGVMPTRPREDSLLPDTERRAAGDELRLASGRAGVEHRHLLAAMAAAGRRVLVYPRGDQRRSLHRPPSRWLLDSCEALGDGTRELPKAAAWHRTVDSFASRVAGVTFPATHQEYRLRALHGGAGGTNGVPAGGGGGSRRLARHPVVTGDGVLARGLDLLAHRGRGAFTRYDGNLESVADRLPSPATPGRVLSPSQLETWLGCPHAHLMQHVLRVQPVDNPEELLEIDALERGSLIHAVLEKWLTAQLEHGVPGGDQAWPAEARALMRRLAVEACDAAETRGVTGHRLLWRRDRTRILLDLERFVDADDERRKALGLTPLAAEHPFGLDGTAPLPVDLGDGRTILVRGRIDRLDRRTAGGLVVTDYKTGGASGYKDLTADQPMGDGTRLQLGLYGLAVQDLDGAAEGVRSEYWFTSARADFARKGYDLTPAVEHMLLRALRVAVDGMERGHFPLKPPTPGWSPWTQCRFCDPDDLGTTDRYREWEEIRRDPELRDYVAYIEPEALEGEAA